MNYRVLAEQSRASQDKFELQYLLQLVGDTIPAVVVEIGVHKGFSMETWRKAFGRGVMYIGIENDPQFIDYHKDYELIIGDSHVQHTLDRLKSFLRGRQIDFLFIDGDHRYEGAKKDLEMYGPLVASGGVIAIHDVMRLGAEWMGQVETAKLFQEESLFHRHVALWGGGDAPGTGVLFKQR